MFNKQQLYAFPVTPLEAAAILHGVAYEAEWLNTSVAAEAKVYARFTTCPEKYTIFNFRRFKMDQERGFYRAYSEFTGGEVIADIPIRKQRLDSTIEPGLVLETFTTPTGITQSSKIIEVPLFGAEGQGNVPTTGGEVDSEGFRVYPPGSEFLLEFSNDSVAATYFQGVLKWIELTEGSIPELEAL